MTARIRRRGIICLGIATALPPLWPAASVADTLSQADRAFLMWDIQIEIQQQDMGRIAEQRARTADVRGLGKYLVDRHQQAQQRLQQLADQLGVTLSDTLSPTHLKVQHRYRSIPDMKFDRAFLRHEVGDYRYFLSHFEAAGRTHNQAIHRYCASEIPRLKEDQAKVAVISKMIGAGKGT